jgi:alkanesulfonate monooxygenase SsuD/methylene tetrahydromethanopterin reductase-like flavin-dependent oxidoreductase (luciferase family)
MTTKPIGLTVFQPTAQAIISVIKMAEQMGIPQVWIPTLPFAPDPIPLLAAAAVQTSTIGLATGISISYPRHPLTLANEALVLAELAPNRFRLGIGASHPFLVEGVYGLEFGKPLEQLREYVSVVRELLWNGSASFNGQHFRVQAGMQPFAPPLPPVKIPIVLATVRPHMFRLAGEISDGAMVSWGPMSYLKKVALPAMEEGAKAANRPRPPLIASAPIVFSADFGEVRQAAYAALAIYAPVPAYIEMFALAGYPLVNGQPGDELIHETFIYGDPDTIRKRLLDMLADSADELQVVICPVKDPMNEAGAIMQLIGSL